MKGIIKGITDKVFAYRCKDEWVLWLWSERQQEWKESRHTDYQSVLAAISKYWAKTKKEKI
jgi:hypothetical protein